MAQVIAGDKNLYGELVKRYQDKLYRYLFYLLYQHADRTADAVQATFIKAYQNLNSYKPQYNFSTWIYRIAHNEAISLLRREKHWLNTVDIDFAPELSDQQDPIAKLAKEETKLALWQALNQLKIKQKQALLLFYIEGNSYERIAEIMQTNKNNVASDIRRAKQKLAEILREEK